MIDNYKVVTLCGSAKFKDEFLKVQQDLTLKGNIVLLPVFFDKDKTLTDNKISMLKDMHMKKINIADEIFVINKNGYLGDSTKLEIEYAKNLSKKINYLEKI